MDLLIQNGTVLTVDSENTIINSGFVAIDGDRIAAVGDRGEAPKKSYSRMIDASDCLVLPGLVNAHTHLTDSLVRSQGADVPLMPWLERLIWPFFSTANGEEITAGARLGALEAVKSGTTTVVENYYASAIFARANFNVLASTLATSGLRIGLVRGYHDNPEMTWDVFIEPIPTILAECEMLIREWHGAAGGRLTILLGPVDPLSSTPESIREVWGLAEEHGLCMHTHVAETEEEVALFRDMYGLAYIEALDQMGVLGPRFISAHGVCLTAQEIEILADRASGIAHNPISNLYLGAGVAPIPEMLRRNVVVGLGTDGACCNNTLDMVETVKMAALIHKGVKRDPTAMSAEMALRVATIGGAKLMGLENDIGSIEAGKKADLIIVRVGKPHTTPPLDPIATFVYSCRGSDVDTVIVDGNILMEGREVVGLDEEAVCREAEGRGRALLGRMAEIA
jgi:5-methylthioadenosine/S-adenosylhomocysteine deaminase